MSNAKNFESEPKLSMSGRNNSKRGDTCASCWESGWAIQFVDPCKKCNGTGKAVKK